MAEGGEREDGAVGAEDAVTGTRGLRLMFDWECHAVWLDTDAGLSNVDPEDVGVSSELARAVRAWGAGAQRTYVPDDPARSGFSDPQEDAAWVDEGRALAVRIAEELGCDVAYYNASAGDVEVTPGLTAVGGR